jgi:hypothetical protein
MYILIPSFSYFLEVQNTFFSSDQRACYVSHYGFRLYWTNQIIFGETKLTTNSILYNIMHPRIICVRNCNNVLRKLITKF